MRTPVVCCLLVVTLPMMHGDSVQGEDKKPAKVTKRRFRISKETTYLTKPLDRHGNVDYAAALDAMGRKGGTSKNNAAVPLARVLGPSKFEGTAKEFFGKLGIPVPPKKGDYFLNMSDFAQLKAGKQAAAYVTALHKEHDQGATRVWSKRELPKLAAWLNHNRTALNTIREATRRKRWFNPVVGVQGEERGLLLGALLPMSQEMRDFARALTSAALLAVSEGRIDDAVRDLMACHRLARLVGQGHFIIDSLVGVAIEAITFEAEIAMLRSGRLADKQLAAYQKEIEALPPLPPVAERVNRAERFVLLDAITYVARRGYKGLKEITDLSEVGGIKEWFNDLKWKVLASLIDWNHVLKKANTEFDRLNVVMRKRRFADWHVAQKKHDEHLGKIRSGLLDGKVFLKKLLNEKKDASAISDTMANVFVALFMPALKQVGVAEDRATTRLKLLRLAIALERYRKANENFPAKLADLQPKFVKKLPQDYFTEKPFRYRPAKDAYLLYSIGINLKDDGGRMKWEDDHDDIAVRVKLAK